MGSILSVFMEEGGEEFTGISAEEARALQAQIRKEYSHPKWTKMLKYKRSLKKLTSKEGGGKQDSMEEEKEKFDMLPELHESRDDGRASGDEGEVVVGGDGRRDSEVERVLQDWESLDSEPAPATPCPEEEDNVRNTLEELGDMDAGEPRTAREHWDNIATRLKDGVSLTHRSHRLRHSCLSLLSHLHNCVKLNGSPIQKCSYQYCHTF